MTLVSDHIVLDKATRQKSFYAAELPLFVTHPHTDGGETPAGPVHQVEEQEAGHRDEVVVCRWTEESSHEKKGRKQRNSTLWSRMCSTSSCCRSVTQPDPTFERQQLQLIFQRVYKPLPRPFRDFIFHRCKPACISFW